MGKFTDFKDQGKKSSHWEKKREKCRREERREKRRRWKGGQSHVSSWFYLVLSSVVLTGNSAREWKLGNKTMPILV